MKKIAIIVIVIIALVIGLLTWGICEKVNQKPYLREACLYAVNIDNIAVLKDSDGNLWEINYLNDITSQDSILLEITNGEVTRTWIEVGPETGIEG